MAVIRKDDEGLYVIAGGVKARPGGVNGYDHAMAMDDGGLSEGINVKARHKGGTPLVAVTLENGEKRYWHAEGQDRTRNLSNNLMKEGRSSPANIAIIKFSDLGNRMDAAFHILRTEHEQRAKQIEQEMSIEEAISTAMKKIEFAPLHFRKKLNPLVRGTSRYDFSREQYEKAVQEYPYLALAIFENLKEELTKHYETLASQATAMAEFFKNNKTDAEI